MKIRGFIKIEFDKGDGEGWRPWVYFREDQDLECNRCCDRLVRLYRSSRWMFRKSPIDESDQKQLRKILRLQGVLK